MVSMMWGTPVQCLLLYNREKVSVLLRQGYFTLTGSNIFISQPWLDLVQTSKYFSLQVVRQSCFTFIRVIDTLYYLMLHTYHSQFLCVRRWFSLGTLVSSTNITEILLKVVLNTITLPYLCVGRIGNKFKVTSLIWNCFL